MLFKYERYRVYLMTVAGWQESDAEEFILGLRWLPTWDAQVAFQKARFNPPTVTNVTH